MLDLEDLKALYKTTRERWGEYPNNHPQEPKIAVYLAELEKRIDKITAKNKVDKFQPSK